MSVCVATGVCEHRRGIRDDMVELRPFVYTREVSYRVMMCDTMRRRMVSAVIGQIAQTGQAHAWSYAGLNRGMECIDLVCLKHRICEGAMFEFS